MATRRGNSWAARVKGPEKYHRYSFKTEHAATQWEKQAREALRNGKTIQPPTVTDDTNPTLGVFFKEHGEGDLVGQQLEEHRVQPTHG